VARSDGDGVAEPPIDDCVAAATRALARHVLSFSSAGSRHVSDAPPDLEENKQTAASALAQHLLDLHEDTLTTANALYRHLAQNAASEGLPRGGTRLLTPPPGDRSTVTDDEAEDHEATVAASLAQHLLSLPAEDAQARDSEIFAVAKALAEHVLGDRREEVPPAPGSQQEARL